MTNQAPDASLDPVDADDVVVPFQIEGMDVRGRMARLGTAVDKILHRHDYPESVSRLLGEALALTALLGCPLKFEGVFSMQISGNGPVSMMAVDFAMPGTLRGYARFDPEKVWAQEEAGAFSMPSLMGDGFLALTVDQGADTEHYQGIVALEGTALSDSVNAYFKMSEQILTEVHAAADRSDLRGVNGESGGGWRAEALLIQHLPDRASVPGPFKFIDDHEKECWQRALALFGTVRADELTDAALAPGQLIYRLYHEDGVRVFDARPMMAGCRCSRARVREVLMQLTPEELAESTVAGVIEITCDFCNTNYEFTREQILTAPEPGTE